MKLLLLLVIAIAVGARALTEEQREKVKKWGEECMKVTGVSAESIRKIRNHEHVDDPKLHDQAFCILKKSGFMTEDGDVQVDVIKNKLKQTVEDENEVTNIVEECAVKKDTPQQTAAHIFKCLHDKRGHDSVA